MTQKLVNLKTTEYEHGFDKAALNSLRALKGVDSITNFVMNWTYVKWHIVELAGSNFHVTKESCPELYEQVKDVADTLDVVHIPEIYTEWGHFINAYTTGYKDSTLLVLYSGAVDLMSDEELRFIIGHEMGHIKSGHVLYHTMTQLFSNIIANMSIAAPLAQPIYLALLYWFRMSEFTADRAGLLACQNVDAALNAVIKMSGLPGKYFSKMDRKAFMEQAKDFQKRYGGFADTAIKNISILNDTHPWTIMRAAELIKWIESGEYERVLNSAKSKACPLCGKSVSADAVACPYCGYKF